MTLQLSRIWPFSAVARYLEWRRRDREETVVAIARFVTIYQIPDGTEIATRSVHIATFLVDGNGVRYVRVATTDQGAADSHGGLLDARERWRTLLDLPRHAERPNRPRTAELVVFPGGAA